MVHNLFWGKDFEQNSVGKNLYSFLFQFIFIPSCPNKNFTESTLPFSLGKKQTFCSLSSDGSWRVLGPSVVLYSILAFFLLSLYIGFRDFTVSLCEYEQLPFTNMYLSTFSCLKKRKRNLKKMGIADQQRVDLRCLGGLKGHFDNLASPFGCLIVMFNTHPCSLR